MTILCLNISGIAITTFKGVDYCCIIQNISKYEAIKLLENSVIEDCGYIKTAVSDFWLGLVNLKNAKHKHLRKNISKELIPIAWYPKR